MAQLHEASAQDGMGQLPHVLQESPRGGTASSDDEQQAMLRRLWKSDELIKQLKHIVKAQHGKIEELRERLEFQSNSARMMIDSQEATEISRVKKDNEECRRTANRLQVDITKIKQENDTLKKVNRRLKAMVQQQQSQASPLPSTMQGDKSVGDSTLHSVGSSRIPDTHDGATSSKPHGHHPRTSLKGMPTCSKLSRLISSVPMLWRDLDSPCSVLRTLIEIAGRVLNDQGSAVLTIYMVDPWLRSVAEAELKDGQPTLFYLGHGNTELQVLTRGSARPEAPCFSDLNMLPYRTRKAIAAAVNVQASHRQFAVLQATFGSDDARSGKHSSRGRASTSHRHPSNPDISGALHGENAPGVLAHMFGHDDGPDSPGPLGYTDTQFAYLQLLCSVAGGLLVQQERLEHRQQVYERMKRCVDVAVTVNKARNLPDFEQRVKHLLGTFFNVTTIRVLFYDAETDKLLISSAQMRRKNCTAIGLDKGIVGLCAKKQQIQHVTNISQHPYVDVFADGLQKNGRPVGSQASMLCGPLVIDSDEGHEGSRLIGVVQLLERSRSGKGSVEAEFSAEERDLFQQLLRVCTGAAWRTLKVQELSAKLDGSPVSLARMLAG